MINITCDKCQSTTEECGERKVNFCPNCGRRFPIDAKKEQPFHLPESGLDMSGMLEKNIKDINILLKCRHIFPADLIKALGECKDILLDIQKMDWTNRKECLGMLGKIKAEAEEEQRAWLENPKWFDDLKKL